MRHIKQMEDIFTSLKEMEWDGIIPEEDIISWPKPCDGSRKYFTSEEKKKSRQDNVKRYYLKHREKILKKIKDNRIWKIRKPTPEIRPELYKKYRITYDNGRDEIIIGFDKWCKDNGYSKGNLHQVKIGKRKSHKGIVAVEKLNTIP